MGKFVVCNGGKLAKHTSNNCRTRILVINQKAVFVSISIRIAGGIRYFQVVLYLYCIEHRMIIIINEPLTDTVLPVVGHLASKSVATL